MVPRCLFDKVGQTQSSRGWKPSQNRMDEPSGLCPRGGPAWDKQISISKLAGNFFVWESLSGKQPNSLPPYCSLQGATNSRALKKQRTLRKPIINIGFYEIAGGTCFQTWHIYTFQRSVISSKDISFLETVSTLTEGTSFSCITMKVKLNHAYKHLT